MRGAAASRPGRSGLVHAVPDGPGARVRAASAGSPRRQLVAIGLASIVLHVAIVGTALDGLGEVDAANEDVRRITAAQRYFQDADMAHDAMRSGTLEAVMETQGVLSGIGTTGGAAAVLTRDVADFREDLRRVDSVALPADLAQLVRRVRPIQEAYAANVEAVAATPPSDAARLRALATEVTVQFEALTGLQGEVTDAMSEESDRRQQAADDAEQSVQWRLVASALAALMGLLALTLLLHRLGGALAALLARERDVAETLQHSLLPDRLPELPGVRLAARYVPGGAGAQVGGDWYDVITLPSGAVGLVMGDVVGHDLQAASSMGQLRNALRAYAAEGAAPEEVLQRLNHLCVTQDMGDMATVLYAVLDPVRGELCVASAGHYPPLLVSEGRGSYLEGAPCPPIGAVRDAQFTSTLHPMPPGSMLVLYTDGLVERRGVAVEHGMARLQDLTAAAPDGEDLEDLCRAVLDGMLEAAGPSDDVALLVVAPQAALGPHLDVLWPAKAGQLSAVRRLVGRWLDEAGASEQERYDVLVACSEAATNAIEHAYGLGPADFRLVCHLDDGTVTLRVRDWGRWREARGRDRGRGLRLMEGLMDEVRVSHGEHGTEVLLRRRLAGRQRAYAVVHEQGVPA